MVGKPGQLFNIYDDYCHQTVSDVYRSLDLRTCSDTADGSATELPIDIQVSNQECIQIFTNQIVNDYKELHPDVDCTLGSEGDFEPKINLHLQRHNYAWAHGKLRTIWHHSPNKGLKQASN